MQGTEKGREKMSLTVKDLIAEQDKRLLIQREKEQVNKDKKFDIAKAQFERKPYHMVCGKERYMSQIQKKVESKE
jgi:hypothetical protein